jgi:hypothetical protein
VKTAFPKNTSFRLPRACRALTVLEMLVSTAMLSLIIIGLTAMFLQTSKAFKSGMKQTDITDTGRTVIDMIASDLSQMSDPHFTNVVNPLYSSPVPNPPTLCWQWVSSYDLFQSNNGVLFRTNQLEDIFATVQSNATWLGIGYTVSNWFTNGNGGPIPGVGTLYRYVTQTNAPLDIYNTLFTNFGYALAGPPFSANLHRIADGVVHLKIYAFDANGNENPNDLLYTNGPLQYPTIVTLPTIPVTYQTNYLPHSIDIELGILEPEAFEHARALYTAGAGVAAGQFLSTCAPQVQIFRQHVIILAAP